MVFSCAKNCISRAYPERRTTYLPLFTKGVERTHVNLSPSNHTTVTTKKSTTTSISRRRLEVLTYTYKKKNDQKYKRTFYREVQTKTQLKNLVSMIDVFVYRTDVILVLYCWVYNQRTPPRTVWEVSVFVYQRRGTLMSTCNSKVRKNIHHGVTPSSSTGRILHTLPPCSLPSSSAPRSESVGGTYVVTT